MVKNILVILLLTGLGHSAYPAPARAALVQPPPPQIPLPITFGLAFQDNARRSRSAGEPGAGLPAFDRAGTAYFRSGTRIVARSRVGETEVIGFEAAMTAAVNRMMAPIVWDGRWEDGPFVDEKIVFDEADFAYTTITPRYSNLKTAVLLFSADKARTWTAHALTGVSAAIEGRDSFNDLSTPPAVLSFDTYGNVAGTNLWLHVFSRGDNGSLVREFDGLVSDRSLLGPNHSGGANSAISTRGKIAIAFPSSVPPASGGAGTEILLRQYDRARRLLDDRIVSAGVAGDVARQPAGPDPHSIPGFTADKAGKLYLFYGAHHGLLKYATSKKPSDVFGGWNAPTAFGNPIPTAYGSYTYLSISMDSYQKIHLFTRYAGDRYKFQLVHMVKPNGRGFRTYAGQSHQVIVDPSRQMYAAYRQQSTVDRAGNIYVFFQYWPNQLTELEALLLSVSTDPKTDCVADRCFYRYRRHLFPTTLVFRSGGDTASLYAAGR